MDFLSSLQSSSFFVIVCVSFFCTFFWVTYSLKEFIGVYRKNLKNRSIRHHKEIDLYQQELKK